MRPSTGYVNPFELKLLDWYAGCVLIGLLAKHGDGDWEAIVTDSFDIAREMLEARSAHVPREAATSKSESES